MTKHYNSDLISTHEIIHELHPKKTSTTTIGDITKEMKFFSCLKLYYRLKDSNETKEGVLFLFKFWGTTQHDQTKV